MVEKNVNNHYKACRVYWCFRSVDTSVLSKSNTGLDGFESVNGTCFLYASILSYFEYFRLNGYLIMASLLNI